MAKFYDDVGYIVTTETAPDVFTEVAIPRKYVGDIIKNTRQVTPGESLNDDVNISNIFSIVADAFAYENIYNIRYVQYMGAKWKVRNIEVARPRLLLTVGGVYND